MKITDDIKQEIIEDLTLVFPNRGNPRINNVQGLLGADAETFSFSYYVNNTQFPLILRIFREISDRAESEFKTLQILYNADLSVPKPYFWKKASRTMSRSYLIMEQVPGELFSDFFFKVKSEKQQLVFLHLFIQELVNIHNFDWKKHFLNLKSLKKPDIESNPYVFCEDLMKFPKKMICHHKIDELKPLIEWLERNKVKSTKLSLLHGDYHLNNTILIPEGKLVVIDWSNLRLGDFRHDLAFTIVTTSSAGKDVTGIFTNFYQTLSGDEVTNIEYFMILSILHNILRCYSALINPQITNENETTRDMFIRTYQTYTRYQVQLVNNIAGVPLPTLENAILSGN